MEAGGARPRPIFVLDIDGAEEADWVKTTIKAEGIVALGCIPLVSQGVVIGKFMNGSAERQGASGSQARPGADAGRVEVQRLGGDLNGLAPALSAPAARRGRRRAAGAVSEHERGLHVVTIETRVTSSGNRIGPRCNVSRSRSRRGGWEHDDDPQHAPQPLPATRPAAEAPPVTWRFTDWAAI